MRAHAPTVRTSPGARRAALTTAALAAVLLTPPVANAGSAAPAQPAAASVALAPTCTPVQPATLTATVTQPASVWDNVGITFTGTLPAGTAAGSCVKIPSVPELPLRSFGAYSAYDPRDPLKPTVGTMYVEADGITFTFDNTFLTSRRNIFFGGSVLAGIDVGETTTTQPTTITWPMPGTTTPPVIQVPPCPDCTKPPEWGYKYAVIDDQSDRVLAGVVLGVKDWERIPGDGWTTRITLSDELGPGQECESVTLHDLTHDAFVGSFPCTSPVTVTFDAFRWSAYKLAVNSRITDRTRTSYTDTGRVTAGGTTFATYSATAPWHKAEAQAFGDRRTSPVGPPPVTRPGTAGEPAPGAEPHADPHAEPDGDAVPAGDTDDAGPGAEHHLADAGADADAAEDHRVPAGGRDRAADVPGGPADTADRGAGGPGGPAGRRPAAAVPGGQAAVARLAVPDDHARRAHQRFDGVADQSAQRPNHAGDR